MKKKLLVAAIAVIMVVTAVTGVSLAYLKDTDSAKNVMTAGNVKIEQNEKDRNGNDFVQNQKLFPAVITGALTKNADGLWTDSINNEIDKIVTVTNTGTESAYIRTIIAFETQRHYAEGSSTVFTNLHDVYLGVNGSFDYLDQYITINGVEYCLAVYTYKGAAGNGKIAAGETTESSLRQIFLSPEAGNEFYDLFGEQYDILVVSQAVQTEGFENAESALNAAFGEITEEKALEWFANVQ